MGRSSTQHIARKFRSGQTPAHHHAGRAECPQRMSPACSVAESVSWARRGPAMHDHAHLPTIDHQSQQHHRAQGSTQREMPRQSGHGQRLGHAQD
eukprot:4397456-Prymnesium_polylepis.1